VLLNPFCPLTTAKVLAFKATVLLLLTLLIKAKVRITAFSAIGFFLLMLQTLVFLAVSGGIVVAAGGAALYAAQQRKGAAA
jgi:D-alanyl-lipoteichoic acid acyltransferase DltB (MBOAT superfamily)